MKSEQTLPTGTKARKNIPLASGVLDYFPAALAAVAELSKAGNDKHNPGEELHHARGKSMDHADCIMRHLTDRGHIDPEDGILHDAKIAWRALAMLQEELERRGAPLARAAKLPGEDKRIDPNTLYDVPAIPIDQLDMFDVPAAPIDCGCMGTPCARHSGYLPCSS